MKRYRSIIGTVAMLLMAGLAFVSCNKESEPVTGKFTVTVNADKGVRATKDLSDNGSTLSATWKEGEQVKVYNSSSDDLGTLTVTTVTNGGGGAILSGTVSGTLAESDELTLKFCSPNYSSQYGSLDSIAKYCDYAIATVSISSISGSTVTTTDAIFANQQAIFKFTVRKADGTTTLNVKPLTVTIGAQNYVINPTTATDVLYVALPAVSDQTVSFSATGSDSKTYTCSKDNVTFAAGNYYQSTLKMALVPPTGAINGLFTINSSGDQVYFSQGNLQAVFASAGTSCTWKFATNQWDCIGSAKSNTSINGNGSVSAAGTVDLFGWVGTSSSYDNYGIWDDTTVSHYGNNSDESLKNDWGHNAITNGGNTADMWRTLTIEEWTYLLEGRSGATVNGTHNVHFAKATIRTDKTGVKGLLLFPDGVTFDASEASWGELDNGFQNYTTTCTSAQWTDLEAKGCVFLPAAGDRTGATVSNAGIAGAYWTATCSETTKAYMIYFASTSWGYSHSYQKKCHGHSVRLVKDAN